MKQHVPYGATALYTFGDRQTYSELIDKVKQKHACYQNDTTLQICVAANGMLKQQLFSEAINVSNIS